MLLNCSRKRLKALCFLPSGKRLGPYFVNRCAASPPSRPFAGSVRSRLTTSSWARRARRWLWSPSWFPLPFPCACSGQRPALLSAQGVKNSSVGEPLQLPTVRVVDPFPAPPFYLTMMANTAGDSVASDHFVLGNPRKSAASGEARVRSTRAAMSAYMMRCRSRGTSLATLVSILGGIGLFLLGMAVMTDGLKAVAGPALRTVLAKAAATSLSGTFWGALITLLVQSSSATTMTTIGLVSAGLLTFPQGLSLVFGANIGTTGTGWLVALLGVRVSLTAGRCRSSSSALCSSLWRRVAGPARARPLQASR